MGWNNRKKLNDNQTWKDLLKEGVNQEYINKKKVVIIDCDGIISTGESMYDKNGKSLKSYGCYDKEIINFLHNYCNYEIIFVSDDKHGFNITYSRINDLGYKLIQANWEQRKNIIKTYIDEGYTTLFIGDSISDIDSLSIADYSGTVNNAPAFVKSYCDYISDYNGAQGGLADILYKIHLEINKYGFNK